MLLRRRKQQMVRLRQQDRPSLRLPQGKLLSLTALPGIQWQLAMTTSLTSQFGIHAKLPNLADRPPFSGGWEIERRIPFRSS